MSLNIGELVAYVKVDHTGVGRGITAAQAQMRAGQTNLANEGRRVGQKAGQAVGDGMNTGVRGGLSKLTSSVTSSLGKLTGIVAGAFAVEKVVGFLSSAKDAASDLNETVNKSAAIFGDQQAAIEEWSKDSARALGLSKSAAQSAAAGLGDMLSQLGDTQTEAAKTSMAVVQMAADLGSFNNLETGDVLERISAALRGEYDSLQAVIPNINAARVETEALAQTGKSSAASLTAQEKAHATLAIIQKDGTRAMGDFAKTADGAANASKTAAAMTEDLKAKVGQELLPAYIALVTFGRDQLIPFLSATVDGAKDVGSEIGDLVGQFRQLPTPIQATTLALVAMVLMRNKVEALGTTVQTKVVGGFKSAKGVVDAVRLSLLYAGDAATKAGGGFKGAAASVGTFVRGMGSLKGAASGVIGLLGGPWGIAFTAATLGVTAFMEAQKNANDAAKDFTSTLDKQTGAATDASRQKIADAFAFDVSPEDLARLRTYGVNLSEAVDAALKGGPVMRAYQERLRELVPAGALEAAVGLSNSIENQNEVVDKSKLVWENSRAILGDTATEADRTSGSLDSLSQSTVDATMSEETRQGILKDTADAQEAANKKVREAAQAILDLHDAQMAAADAEIGYQQSIDDTAERVGKLGELQKELDKAGGVSDRTKRLQEQLAETTDKKKRAKLEKELADSRSKDAKKQTEEQARIREEMAKYTHTLDTNTQAGRDNKKALLDLATNAKAARDKSIEQGKGQAEVNKQMADARTKFIEYATALGGGSKAARAEATRLANDWGLTIAEADKAREAITGIPSDKTVKVDARTENARTNLADLKGQLDGTPTTKTVTVNARTANARAAIEDLRTDLNSLPSVQSITVRINAKRAAIDDMRESLGLSVTKQRHGGILSYARGGMRNAAIYQDGADIVRFAEKGTGGEAYIPLGMGNRPRSTAILRETAGQFGYDLTPAGSGASKQVIHHTPVHIEQLVSADLDGAVEQSKATARARAVGQHGTEDMWS